jgi:hypothetical protein
MKNYTGKFNVGDTVKLIDAASRANGITGSVTEINLSGRGYPYRVDFGVHHAYHPESELGTAETIHPQRVPVAEYQSMDIDSGLGTGGIDNDQSVPIIPSLRAIERVQKMHDTDTVCKRCGQSANFDGAMFTTLCGSNICDDCA